MCFIYGRHCLFCLSEVCSSKLTCSLPICWMTRSPDLAWLDTLWRYTSGRIICCGVQFEASAHRFILRDEQMGKSFLKVDIESGEVIDTTKQNQGVKIKMTVNMMFFDVSFCYQFFGSQTYLSCELRKTLHPFNKRRWFSMTKMPPAQGTNDDNQCFKLYA